MGEYTITISPDGSSIKTDAQGFSDSKCMDGMDEIFRKLGTVDVEKKPEAHINNSNNIKLR